MFVTNHRAGQVIVLMAGALGALAASCRPASAYIEIPPATLGKLCGVSTDIRVLKVEKVSAEQGVILFSVVEDLKGKPGVAVPKQVIGPKVPGADIIFDWAVKGKTAVLFAAIAREKEGGGSVVQGYGYAYIDNYWYSLVYDVKGECWKALKGDPTLLTRYCGGPDKLRDAVADIVRGKEVVVPCMVGGNREDLIKRRAKVQRVRASLKLRDFDAKRDFVGWGAADEKRPAGPLASPPAGPPAAAGEAPRAGVDLLGQVLLVGLGADAQQDVADGELGLAEGAGAAADQGASDLQEIVRGGLGDGFGPLTGFGFLVRGEGSLHGGLSEWKSGFLDATGSPRLVYKESTKMPDAYTPGLSLGFPISPGAARL